MLFLRTARNGRSESTIFFPDTGARTASAIASATVALGTKPSFRMNPPEEPTCEKEAVTENAQTRSAATGFVHSFVVVDQVTCRPKEIITQL
jgi:hypothetical protein